MRFCYNPLDFPPMLQRAFTVLRPRGVLAIEAFWPNAFATARARGIPTAWVPRISPRSRGRYARLGQTAGALFSLADPIMVGFPCERDWLIRMGVPGQRIVETGSVKFDLPASSAPVEPPAFRARLDRLGWVHETGPIIIGGSTFPGEETLLIRACREAFGTNAWRLICVPRHVERARSVVRECAALGETVALRSEESVRRARVLVVDTTGELADWYACAGVAVVGKSFLARGGQNPVEPCLAGCRVLAGPHLENFLEIATDLEAGGLLDRVAGAGELAGALRRAAAPDHPGRASIREMACKAVARHRGAAGRVAEALLDRILPRVT